MKAKKYLVTNNSEGSICVTGRSRIDIPGLCKDLPLMLPENTARQTIMRLKQRYPLLKFKEVDSGASSNMSNEQASQKQANGTAKTVKVPETANPDSGDDENKSNSEQDPEKANVSSVASEKSDTQDSGQQDKLSAQKSASKKGK